MSVKRNTKLLRCKQANHPLAVEGTLTGTLTVEGDLSEIRTIEGCLVDKKPIAGNLTFPVETDPTVPAWAKQPNPPAAILMDTIDSWESQDLISADKTIYVYIDDEDSDESIYGIKFGDGVTPLNDLPFFGQVYTEGDGIRIQYNVISLDDLILECGTSTTVLHEVWK